MRRLYRAYGVDQSIRVGHVRRAKIMDHQTNDQIADEIKAARSKSTNAKAKRKGPQEKYGINIPSHTQEALLFDKMNGTTFWADAITKEMGNLDRLGVFQYFSPDTRKEGSDGWQKAPMRMIFDVKKDGRYKARLVVGGHVIDSSEHETFFFDCPRPINSTFDARRSSKRLKFCLCRRWKCFLHSPMRGEDFVDSRP